MQQFGFIGCGNMGGALARAVSQSAGGEGLLLADYDRSKAQALADELGAAAGDNETVARSCGMIFLGVKPQFMAEMLASIAPILAGRSDRFVLVTMAAGISCARIRALAGGDYPVIRVMPNTPVFLGCGMVQYCHLGATGEELTHFTQVLAPAGLLDPLPESLIDAATAVSSCGPAYAYLFIEALADGGVACGLPRDKAQRYAAQMAAGAAQMVLQSGLHPGQLKDQVCSPGGSTIQGVRALEAGGLRSTLFEAVVTAYEKTKALG